MLMRDISFYSGLALRVGERGVSAFGVFINSVLIARTLADQEAAAYFVVVSVCQLVISPWVAGADYVWIRYRSDGIAPQNATDRVFMPIVLGSLVSALVSIAVCVPLLAGTGAFMLLLACAVGNCVFSAITLQLASKFGQPARYLAVSVSGGVLAIGCKLAVLVLAAGEYWIIAALFCEYYLVAALAMLFRPRRTGTGSGASASLREFLALFAGPAFLVVATIVSLRLALLVTSRTMAAADYVAFGLAFQVMNAVSVVSAAVSNSVVASSIGAGGTVASVLAATRRGFIAVAALFTCFAAFLYAFGQPVLGFLLQARGGGVHKLAMAGLFYSAYVLVLGICSALASVTHSTRSYSWSLIGMTTLSTAVLALAPVDRLGARIALWGLTSLVASLLVSRWLIGRARPGGAGRSWGGPSVPRPARKRPSQ